MAEIFDAFVRPAGWADYNLLPFHPAPVGADLKLPPETWDLFGDHPEGLPFGEFAAAGHGWLNLRCGSDHYVTVTIETLSSAPPALAESWEEAMEFPWSTSASAVQLWQLTGGPDSPPIGLPPSQEYRVRVAARGRHLPLTGLDGAIEDWLVQFCPWPAADPVRVTHPRPFRRQQAETTDSYWSRRLPAVDILTVLRTPGRQAITTTIAELAGEINASKQLTAAGLEAAVQDDQVVSAPWPVTEFHSTFKLTRLKP